MFLLALYILLDKHLFYIDTNSQVSRYSGIFTKTGKKITKNSQNCQGAAPISNNGMKLNFTVVVGHTEIIFHLKNQASISMFTIFSDFMACQFLSFRQKQVFRVIMS